MNKYIKNHELLTPLNNEPHAFAKFRIDAQKHSVNLIEEIALGQSLGAWDTKNVAINILRKKIAKIVNIESDTFYHEATVAFPFEIWQGKLSWLMSILFGKMSFFEGVQLNSVWFSQDCFNEKALIGPKNNINNIRISVGADLNKPLLMGILKPNVGMSTEKISELYVEAAEAGVHLLKDDEIRHDSTPLESLKRVSLIAEESAKRNLKTLYAVHLQIDGTHFLEHAKALENAGASAFLLNTWITGIDVLQELRKVTNLPIVSHPALVGAFGIQETTATIHPRVTLAQFIRAAGADLSLFPSPYGKLGLNKDLALDIAKHCLLKNNNWHINETIPVPSAGIKPEHAPLAKKDFGNNFILNAGTGIFTHPKGINVSIKEFLKEL
ncbi:RuBisCO large subunit C-terminal-like domain-containing protein [Fluviispira sanaruensis]|uniref:2,3-diketo-5-methylthiopentyl-1-phosphate enolase n=1 Tax=Fluviispira sanaruensis TaxID=2493639 RepID=A0A4P2VH36_FLUSA|nr:RuBisCO large subunit C-terminal-like domain-containing protein [Fluviispira sanaruensis]BBH52253.1 2,3-diketo-5-methylthiopentyl-1-phosphate enolase [Fluviispira sanaruensis]